jgi:hypothetical protein
MLKVIGKDNSTHCRVRAQNLMGGGAGGSGGGGGNPLAGLMNNPQLMNM